MSRNAGPPDDGDPVLIEPDGRLVVLARTLHAEGAGAETAWSEDAADWNRHGETCLGRALYRHRSVFQSASDAPVWSHLELTYFRDLVPLGAVRDLALKPAPAGVRLLRAEILLTTPSSFVVPRGWRGSADHPERRASLEYIDVRPAHLAEYRDVMRRYIGPAAARLVGLGKFGTFRAMETAAVLHQDASLDTEWNQIHLCEVDPEGFAGFGQEFDAVLREMLPDGGFAGVFAGLGRVRTISRWTFNEPVVEADGAIAGLSATKQPL